MRKPRHSALAAAATMALLGVLAPSALADDTVTKPYTAPTGDVQTIGSPTGPGTAKGDDIGGAAFQVPYNGTADITVNDAHSPLPVGASWNTAGPNLPGGVGLGDPTKYGGGGTFCGTVKGIPVSATDPANQLWVNVGVINQDQDAPFNKDTSIGCGKPSPGTLGTITVTFHPGAAGGGAASHASVTRTITLRQPARAFSTGAAHERISRSARLL
jgi:hypothetical protein